MTVHHRPGRHELGQNFLTDRRTIRSVVQLAAAGDGPLVEWAAGNGALTSALAALDRPLEAVEIDSRRVAQLRRRLPPHVCITEGDILRHAPPVGPPCTIVCNVPFSITTPVLRRLLSLTCWHEAILITQWEVARKRAAVGGATQLTAQWWPWFTFRLHQRIPAAAFVPRPSVDAGLLGIRRRSQPLVTDRVRYQTWVKTIVTGAGQGLPQVLSRASGLPGPEVRAWCRRQGLTSRALPRDLTAEQWAEAWTWTSARRRPGGRAV
jgi:23S rRNA (adenine-N6)-dimethyltransferase